ncbi:uncharacterized protein PAC_19620 [Phialocephala subalpina]|uniref:Uncharacterized protein n=1 Tax=Phialocephala subalpina TaxID=576137 RepID=A0A1L7XXJ1_9HELO|nr:uncharacterized protein PAC_19620 [Phialocephala subalpina]
MTFEVATGTDSVDGNRRREPPRTSLAGEVLKKKRQLDKSVVPPPALPTSFSPDVSQFDMQPEEGSPREDLDEHRYIVNNLQCQRPSNIADNSNQYASTSSSSQSTDRPCASISLSVPQLLAALETVLKVHPPLKQYIRYKLPLERKGTGQIEVPITPIFYRDSCEICLDHGDSCIVEQGTSSSKCAACTQFGGRCIFANLEGTTPRKADIHLNCGRCAAGFACPIIRPLSPVKLSFSPSKFLDQKDRRELLTRSELSNVWEMQAKLGEAEEQRLGCVDSLQHLGKTYISEIPASTQLTSLERRRLKLLQMRREREEREERERLEREARMKQSREERIMKERMWERILENQRIDRRAQYERKRQGKMRNMTESHLTSKSWWSYLKTSSATSDYDIPQTELLGESYRSNVHRRNETSTPVVDFHEALFSPPPHQAASTNLVLETDLERMRLESSRLASLFHQPHRPLFQADSSPRDPTSTGMDFEESDDISRPWRKYREVKVLPEGPTEPLFKPKTKKQLELEAGKMYAEKMYIPKHITGIAMGGRDETPTRDTEIDARKQLRRGYGEAQGGELIFPRIEALGLEDEGEDKAAVPELEDEELSTEEFWKRKFEENVNEDNRNFWELEPRRHR